MSRAVIYTGIFGGYDTLRDQPVMPGVDLVCFTDDPHMTSKQWRVVHGRSRGGHPRMASKWFRTHPHRVLPDHPVSIWIDGGVQIEREDFADVVLDAMGDRGLSMFRHPVRDTIAAEAAFCVDIPKYRGQPMPEQVEHYRRKGFPDESGLWATGILGRDSSRRVIRRLGNQWWRENRRWTYQDQLSMSYLLWRYDLEPGVIPYGLWDGELLSMVPHASEL